MTEVALIKEALLARGVELGVADVPYSDPNVPLSWHLLESQKRRIREEWAKFEKSQSVCDIQRFLYGDSCL